MTVREPGVLMSVPKTRTLDHRYAVYHQRFTLGMPEGKRKTLVDLWEPGLALRWSNRSLVDVDAFQTIGLLAATDRLEVIPDLPPGWQRVYQRAGSLPILEMEYRGAEGRLRIEALGGQDADLVKMTVETDDHPLTLSLTIRSNVATCHTDHPMLQRSDNSFLCFVTGAADCARSWITQWQLRITLPATGQPVWLIIPHATDITDLSTWQARDWAEEWRRGEQAWRALLGRAVRFIAPDAKMLQAYYACLADQFILREPLADGQLGFLCGTDIYRAINAYEIDVHVHALLRAGYYDEAWQAAEVLLSQQRADGRWENYSPWMTTFWFVNGDIPLLFHAWYRFTGDRRRMAEIWPQLVKLARWIEQERSKSKHLPSDDPRYGLLPPGVGDSGICRDLHLGQDKGPHHVFLPQNAGSVGGLRVIAELAREFGTDAEQQELAEIYDDARDCLLRSMERCAVPFAGGRYVPASTEGAAGGGSLWNCTAFAHPWGLLPCDHPLVTGTLAWFAAQQSPTGIPYNGGWQSHGLWPGGAIENPAPVYLRRGEIDTLTDLIYAALNHGSPVWTWPEERQPGAGTPLCTGDLQEAWLPVNFCRLFRDLFLYEEDDTLHLAAGIPRGWYQQGPIGVEHAPSYFGPVSYTLEYHEAAGTLTLHGVIGSQAHPCPVIAHLHLPEACRITGSKAADAEAVQVEGNQVSFTATGEFTVVVEVA